MASGVGRLGLSCLGMVYICCMDCDELQHRAERHESLAERRRERKGKASVFGQNGGGSAKERQCLSPPPVTHLHGRRGQRGGYPRERGGASRPVVPGGTAVALAAGVVRLAGAGRGKALGARRDARRHACTVRGDSGRFVGLERV